MMKFIIAIFAICIAQIAFAEKCNEACPRNYRPLCAVDNTGNFKTFANKCIFEAEQCNNRGAGWKVLTPTVCPSTPLKTVNKCNEACPRIYSPVCGVDNFGNRKTFSNNCVFEAEDCNNRGAGWKILSSDACDTIVNVEDSVCNEVCPRLYAPVCGIDNFGSRKTFANKCVFDAEDCNNRGAGWRVQENSECEEVAAVNDELCPVICPALLSPLCGIDNTGRQRTFSNKCLFDSESCSNRGAGWRILDHEECKPLAMKLMTPTCTNACTDDLTPVWAMDNTGNKRQFDNLCEFNNIQCENRGAGWKLITE